MTPLIRVPLVATLLPLALLFAATGQAQEEGLQPIVRARVETETPVMVGETVTLSVEVLTPSWFPRAPQFPAALQVENAVAVFDESFRTNLSERIDGDSWSGIRRHYLVYPQLAGAYTVPPIQVEVVYALPNARPSEPLTLTGHPLSFEARVPPEAAGLDYFIAAAFPAPESVDAVLAAVEKRPSDSSGRGGRSP